MRLLVNRIILKKRLDGIIAKSRAFANDQATAKGNCDDGKKYVGKGKLPAAGPGLADGKAL